MGNPVDPGQPMPAPYQAGQPMPPPPPGYSQAPPGYSQPSYQYGAPPPAHTVIITTSGACLSPYPMQLECPNCHQHVVTITEYENGGMTYLLGGLICLFGGWFGCCLIPTCIDGCKDVLHTCPNCKVFVGRFKRL